MRVWRVVAALVLTGVVSACSSSAAADPNDPSQVGTATDRAVLEAAVHVASAGLGGVAATSGGGYEAAVIRNFVNAVRFLGDRSGYFFVYDYNTNVCVAHAVLADFVGQDKTSYQDSRGLYVIQELAKLARSTSQGGYLVYHWNNPNTGQEERKLGYVEVIPGTTLYIGSGVYVP